MRKMTGNLSRRWTMIGSAIKDFDLAAGQFIQRRLQKRAGFKVAHEKTFVFHLNVTVENRVRRHVDANDKSAPVECDRGQAHRIQRVCGGRGRSARARNGGDFDQALDEGSENTLFLSAQLATV